MGPTKETALLWSRGSPFPWQPPAPATVVGVRAQHSVRPQRPPGSQHPALSLQAPEQAFRGQEPQAPSARRGLNVLGGGPSPPHPSRMPTILTVRHEFLYLQLRFRVMLRAKASQEAQRCGPGRGYLSEATRSARPGLEHWSVDFTAALRKGHCEDRRAAAPTCRPCEPTSEPTSRSTTKHNMAAAPPHMRLRPELLTFIHLTLGGELHKLGRGIDKPVTNCLRSGWEEHMRTRAGMWGPDHRRPRPV